MGPNVNAFEADLERFVNRVGDSSHSLRMTDGGESLDRKVVCLSAGTAAVHLALIACGVKAVYADAVAYVNGVSEEIFKVGFCLPAGPYVTDEDVRYIVDCIKEAIVTE